MRGENSVIIDRPVEDVFRFLSIPQNNELWMGMVVGTIRDAQGPVEVGETWKHQVKFLGRLFEFPFEVVEFEPSHRYCVRNAAGPISLYGCFTLEPADGGTRFTHSIEGEAGNFFRFTDAIVERAALRQFEADHATLKELLEARVDQAQPQLVGR